jgi:hypothetical protein
MARVTFNIPDDLEADIKRLATGRGVSVPELIRRVVTDYARENVTRERSGPRPKPRSLGIGNSGHTDTAQLASDFGLMIRFPGECCSARDKS